MERKKGKDLCITIDSERDVSREMKAARKRRACTHRESLSFGRKLVRTIGTTSIKEQNKILPEVSPEELK